MLRRTLVAICLSLAPNVSAITEEASGSFKLRGGGRGPTEELDHKHNDNEQEINTDMEEVDKFLSFLDAKKVNQAFTDKDQKFDTSNAKISRFSLKIVDGVETSQKHNDTISGNASALDAKHNGTDKKLEIDAVDRFMGFLDGAEFKQKHNDATLENASALSEERKEEDNKLGTDMDNQKPNGTSLENTRTFDDEHNDKDDMEAVDRFLGFLDGAEKNQKRNDTALANASALDQKHNDNYQKLNGSQIQATLNLTNASNVQNLQIVRTTRPTMSQPKKLEGKASSFLRHGQSVKSTHQKSTHSVQVGDSLFDEQSEEKSVPAAREAHHSVRKSKADWRFYANLLRDRLHASRAGANQTNSSDVGGLPDIPQLLHQTRRVLDGLDTDLSGLKAELAQAENDNRQAVADRKSHYEKLLMEEHLKTAEILKKNLEIDAEIKLLASQNKAMRLKADDLVKSSSGLRHKLSILKSNLTDAQAKIEASLSLETDSKDTLAALTEFREAEGLNPKLVVDVPILAPKTDMFVEASNRKIDTTKAEIALLQFDESPDTLELLRALSKKFDDLDREQVASMTAMYEEFKSQMKKETRVQEIAKEEQKKLTKSRLSQLELRERLSKAVQHLQATDSELKGRIASIKGFTERVR